MEDQMPRISITQAVITFFDSIGEVSLFGLRAIKESFRRPVEFGEIVNQMFEVGWRTVPLVMFSGFAFGIVIALETRSEMLHFGAEAMIPQAVSLGLFFDIGPLLTGLLVAGRAGAGIGAELAGMRVTEQIDALEAIAVDSFKYLVVTRIVACVLALPILTLIFDFSGLAGGIVADMVTLQMSLRLFLHDAFSSMGWSEYIPPTFGTVIFGFLIGTLSCYLGYNAEEGAVGVGRASTRSVVFSSLLVILAEVIIVKSIQFWWP